MMNKSLKNFKDLFSLTIPIFLNFKNIFIYDKKFSKIHKK